LTKSRIDLFKKNLFKRVPKVEHSSTNIQLRNYLYIFELILNEEFYEWRSSDKIKNDIQLRNSLDILELLLKEGFFEPELVDEIGVAYLKFYFQKYENNLFHFYYEIKEEWENFVIKQQFYRILEEERILNLKNEQTLCSLDIFLREELFKLIDYS